VTGGIVSNTNGGTLSLNATATLKSSGTLTNHEGATILNVGQIQNNASLPAVCRRHQQCRTISNSAGGTINVTSSYLHNFIVTPSGGSPATTSRTIRHDQGGALTLGVPNQSGGLVGIDNPVGARISSCAITTNTSGMILNTPGIGMLSGAAHIDDGVVGSTAGPAITNNGKIFQWGTMIVSSLVNNADITNASATGIISSRTARRSRATSQTRPEGPSKTNSTATITFPRASKGTVTNNGTIANNGRSMGTQGASSRETPAPFGSITGTQPVFP